MDVDRGLAGRVAERVQVAGVLSGSERCGALLVLGEAGIGKSRLVRAAMSDAGLGGVLVLVGRCLPLGTGMPLLPFGDLIRMAHEVDSGQWMTAALAECPRYSGESVALLVPELGELAGRQPAAATADGYPWWRQQLFASVRALFAALGRARAAALVIEDLHWADTSTLELLEYLLRPGRPIGLPVVLTFRSEDAETPKQNASWLAWVKRSDLVDVLRLGALSRRETADQLELLTGQAPDPAVAEEVFRRSEGNALFTEQLVGPEASSPLVAALPNDLLELLGARIGELDPHTQATARVLAVAGRPLEAQMLMAVTGLSHDDLLRALRDLKSRRLLRSVEADGRHALRHVLLGEAVVADMLPVERVETNRRLATSLAASGSPSQAAELAAHWREAGSMEEELHWRVRAARDADAVYANEQASAHWLRAIELWDRAAEPEGCADLELGSLFAAAEDALEFAGHSDRACALAEAAFGRLAAVASGSARAELYLRLGYFQGPAAVQCGLDALDEAIKLYEQLPPSPGLLRAYGAERELLQSQGRHDEAAQLSERALGVSECMDDRAWYAVTLGERAWDDMAAGDPGSATRRMNQAWEAAAGQSDPRVNVYLAGYHTDILLKTGASSVDVERAAAPGLQAMIDFGLDEDHNASELRLHVAQARIACGQVDRAADLLDPVIDVPASRDTLAVVIGLAEIAMLRGDVLSAQARLAELEQMTFAPINFRVEIDNLHAGLELWQSDPHSAYDRTVELLNVSAASGQSRFMGRALVIVARAAADINEPGAGTPARARARISGASLNGLREAMADDPLAARRVPADAAAQLASWEAELARSRGESSSAAWENAASEWDQLNRPHHAAYSRWRQAEALLADRGTRTQATSVLRRAAKQAQQHDPLTTAIHGLSRRARIDLTEPEAPPRAVEHRERPASTAFGLTGRELAVLRMLGEGKSNTEIGAALFISRKTASVHVTNILRKLNVATRVQAATIAQRAGLLASDPPHPGAT